MASNSRGTAEELYRMALAALSGAADETSFGLSNKIPGSKEIQEENPGSATVGRVASYLIPGTGVVGGAGKILKLLRGGKEIKAAIPAASGLSGVLKGVGKGSLYGGVESAGQTILRKLTGASDGDVLDNAQAGAIGGGLIGGALPIAGAAARGIYSHPSIFNKKSIKSPELMQKLMDEGVYGGEGTFRRYADKAKKKYDDILSPLREGISKKKVDINEVLGEGAPEGFAEREFNKKSLGLSASRNFAKARIGTKNRLGPEPKMGEVNDYLSAINKELSSLQPQKRAEAITGVGGSASNEDQALGALKSSIEALENKMIKRKYGEAGASSIKTAKDSYGTGRELERALNRPESLGQALKGAIPVPGIAGVASGLGAGAAGFPALATGLTVGGLAAGARSLPGRTFTGVMLNKASKMPVSNPSSGLARLLEMSSGREKPEEDSDEDIAQPERTAQPDMGGADNEFMKFVPKNNSPTKDKPPPVDDAARASGRKFGMTEVELQLIRDPVNPEHQAAFKALDARRDVYRRKKRAEAAKNEEESVDDGDNPFLKFVPKR